MADYDLIIIGGGINGTAIARDAAGRGLRVLLVEQNDLASGTSWTSTKLIHGGLRYLEHGAFRLVQEGLQERAILLKTAPHLVWPMRFILPHHAGLRPAWQLRLGLFIYDMLGGAKILPGAQSVALNKDETGTPLKEVFRKGFEYSDCCVDDVRLVVLNAVDAAMRGAQIRTRMQFTGATRKNGNWQVTLKANNQTEYVMSRALINAAGPWIENVTMTLPQEVERLPVRLVKGSHIVVPKLFEHKKSYIFQNADGRIVFAIPYQGQYTLLGTTEVVFNGNPAEAAASEDEISYLCKLANDYFRKPVLPQDVVWSFAGVRALYDSRNLSAKDLSRDYFLKLDAYQGAPLLSVYGGKLTAARCLAEIVLEKLRPFLPTGKAWTGTSPLPGGDFDWNTFEDAVQRAQTRWPFLKDAIARRLFRAYGTRIALILGDAKCIEDLGVCFGADLTEAEVHYLKTYEWAKTAGDILWRRSKLGLFLTPAEKEKLSRVMET